MNKNSKQMNSNWFKSHENWITQPTNIVNFFRNVSIEMMHSISLFFNPQGYMANYIMYFLRNSFCNTFIRVRKCTMWKNIWRIIEDDEVEGKKFQKFKLK